MRAPTLDPQELADVTKEYLNRYFTIQIEKPQQTARHTTEDTQSGAIVPQTSIVVYTPRKRKLTRAD